MTTPWLRVVASRAAVTLIAVLALLTAGCTLNYLVFDVHEGGRRVRVQKFFNDGLGDNDHARAFEVARRGDLDGAVRILEGAARRDPNDEWTYYNLAIVHEARGDWPAAERAIKIAIREEAQDHPRTNRKKRAPDGADAARFRDELAFIERHSRR